MSAPVGLHDRRSRILPSARPSGASAPPNPSSPPRKGPDGSLWILRSSLGIRIRVGSGRRRNRSRVRLCGGGPSGATFKALALGEPLLFRLKAPHNVIAGVGFFVHFSVLPASLVV